LLKTRILTIWENELWEPKKRLFHLLQVGYATNGGHSELVERAKILHNAATEDDRRQGKSWIHNKETILFHTHCTEIITHYLRTYPILWLKSNIASEHQTLM